MPKSVTPTRARIVAAASREFARRGFAGASVDRIAASARVNKAMIYYHFASKAALYRAILRDMFATALAEADAIALRRDPPGARIDAFIEAIARNAEARPHFPPIWLRELAEGGRHLDADTVRLLRGIPAALAGIIRDGQRTGLYGDVDPLFIHFSIVGPLLLFLASAPIRRRLEPGSLAGSRHHRDALVTHLKASTRALLTSRRPRPAEARFTPARDVRS